jgi:FMN-dependent NADH-azoreductase
MAKNVLVVTSGANHPDSVSRKLVARFAAGLAGKGAAIVNRDATEGISHVTNNWIVGTRTESTDPAAVAALAESNLLVDELLAADTLVIAAPMYNFGVPAALKAWIDQICRAGRTFNYTPQGPVGTVEGKRAYVVITTGGAPVGSPVDFVSPYLKAVLGFIGITDVTVVAVDALSGPDANAKIAAAEVALDGFVAAIAA